MHVYFKAISEYQLYRYRSMVYDAVDLAREGTQIGQIRGGGEKRFS